MSKFAPILETIVSTFETTVGKEKALQAKNVKEDIGLLPLPAPLATTTTSTNTNTLR